MHASKQQGASSSGIYPVSSIPKDLVTYFSRALLHRCALTHLGLSPSPPSFQKEKKIVWGVLKIVNFVALGELLVLENAAQNYSCGQWNTDNIHIIPNKLRQALLPALKNKNLGESSFIFHDPVMESLEYTMTSHHLEVQTRSSSFLLPPW